MVEALHDAPKPAELLSDFKIELVTPEMLGDADRLRLHEYYKKYLPNDFGEIDDPLQEAIEAGGRNDQIIFWLVRDSEGKVVASTNMSHAKPGPDIPLPEDRWGCLLAIGETVVDESVRRQGLATQLIERAVFEGPQKMKELLTVKGELTSAAQMASAVIQIETAELSLIKSTLAAAQKRDSELHDVDFLGPEAEILCKPRNIVAINSIDKQPTLVEVFMRSGQAADLATSDGQKVSSRFNHDQLVQVNFTDAEISGAFIRKILGELQDMGDSEDVFVEESGEFMGLSDGDFAEQREFLEQTLGLKAGMQDEDLLPGVREANVTSLPAETKYRVAIQLKDLSVEK